VAKILIQATHSHKATTSSIAQPNIDKGSKEAIFTNQSFQTSNPVSRNK